MFPKGHFKPRTIAKVITKYDSKKKRIHYFKDISKAIVDSVNLQRGSERGGNLQ